MGMKKTGAVKLYDKIQALAKAQGRENEVVKMVIVEPQKANGVCIRCQEEGEVLRFSVYVYTEGYPPTALKEEIFTIDYCEWCLDQVRGHNKDALKVMFG